MTGMEVQYGALIPIVSGFFSNKRREERGRITDNIYHLFALIDSSTLLITGSAANEMRLYEVATGKCLKIWEFSTAVKRVQFSSEGTQVLVVTEERMGHRGTLQVFAINRDSETWTNQENTPTRTITFSGRKATVAAWAPFDEYIVTGHDDGKVALYYHDEKEPESGVDAELEEKSEMAHDSSAVTDLQMSSDRTYFVTSSKDKTAKVSMLFTEKRERERARE